MTSTRLALAALLFVLFVAARAKAVDCSVGGGSLYVDPVDKQVKPKPKECLDAEANTSSAPSSPPTPAGIGRKLRAICDDDSDPVLCRQTAEACAARPTEPDRIVICREARLYPEQIADARMEQHCTVQSDTPECASLRKTCRAGFEPTCEQLKASVCPAGDRSSALCPQVICTPANLRTACDELTTFGSNELETSLSIARVETPERLGGTTTDLRLAIGGHAIFGDSLGSALGMRGDLGVALGGAPGFAYDFDLTFGLGFRDGPLSLAITAGGGLSGITGGHVPFALRVPLEAYAATDLSSVVRARAFVRPAWVYLSESRKDGSKLLEWFDELEGGVGLLIGPRRNESGWTNGSGLYLGFAVREWLGTRAYVVTVGRGNADTSE